MEIQGRIVQKLEPKGGTSQRGSWKKQDFIIETNESFPKKICITNFNDKVDLSSFNLSDEVTASVNIESREFNGNWYTDIKVWKMEKSGSKANTGSSLPGTGPADAPPPPWEEKEDADQDLPF